MIKKDKNNNVGEIEKKYLKIKNEVISHNKLYYEDNNPIITDIEYDALWKKLKSYEEKLDTAHYKNTTIRILDDLEPLTKYIIEHSGLDPKH